MKRLTIIILALSTSLLAHAQGTERPSDTRKSELEELAQQFSRSRNAAGMGLSQPGSGSFTTISIYDEKGDFHRAQEGDEDKGFSFSSSRYDSFSEKLFMKSSFSYTLDNEKNRKWSDVIDPYFSIPYIYGSSVAKDYSGHDCLLGFDLYTAPLSDLISFGVKARYEVMDISGNRDPRPRTGYLDYEIIPSVLFSFGGHHIGIDAGFNHRKEKLQNLTTIQSYPNLYYYKMAGLDRIDGAISAYSGFKRQFIGNGFISDLSYSYTSKSVEFLLSGGVEGSLTNAFGDKKQSPGSYNDFSYKALMDLVVSSGINRHHISVTGTMTDGGADEKLQELNSRKDPETGITTETWETLYEYKNRYMMKKQDIRAGYEIFGACSDSEYLWKLGVDCGYTGFMKECFLPYSSFQVAGVDAGLEGSLRLVEWHAHKLDVDAGFGYFKSLRSELGCSSTNIYVEEVLRKDEAYHSADCNSFRLGADYTIPMNLGKAGRANGYVRLEWKHTKAMEQGLNALTCTVGIFTF